LQFSKGEITGRSFENSYLKTRRKSRTRNFGQFNDLDAKVFSAIDAFCDDPDLREPGDLDEGGLRAEVEAALREVGMPY
jgi:hypothetical protein